MKVYCAGPLFTPYERAYMSKCGAALREVGIDAFVPHESFKLTLPPEAVRRLADRGLLEEAADAQDLSDRVRQLLRDGVVTREELGLPTGTSAKKVYDNDFGAIAASNAILAVVNGPEVDDGTACEIGIFYALMGRDPAKKGVVALHEDWRTQESPGEGKGLNGFVLGCLLEAGQVVHDLDEAVAVIARWRDELEGDA
jgi:nucleoside 2-deoxyribosyltransferase